MRSLTYAEAITGVMRALLPVREQPKGTNRGQMVDAFARAAGYRPEDGLPWCLMVLYYAGRALYGREWPLPRTGSCDLAYAWAKRENRLRPAGEAPQPGDVGLVQPRGRFQPGNPAEHAFLVTAVAGAVIETIEGNTATDGGREGVGVFARKRKLGGPVVYHFIRLGDA